MLSDQLITEFMEIYSDEFDEKVTREQALSHGLDLVRLLATVNKIKVKKYDNEQPTY